MRRTLPLILKIAVSATLLYFALRKIDLNELWTRLGSGSAGWLVAAIMLAFVQVFVAAMRWRDVTDACQAPLRLWQAFRFNLIGTFFNQVLPSSIGGDALRIWLVKNTSAGWRNAAYSVFVDRALGLIVLAVLVIVSLPWSYRLITDEQGKIALLVIDLAAVAGGAGFLLLAFIPWPFLKRWWLTHHPMNCSAIANRTLFSAKGVRITLLSALIHTMTAGIAWLAAKSIGAPVSLQDMFLLMPPVILITMLPITIAGWGVRETTMMTAFTYAQLPPSDGIIISLLFGAVNFFVGLCGGLVWIASREKAQRDSAGELVLDDKLNA